MSNYSDEEKLQKINPRNKIEHKESEEKRLLPGYKPPVVKEKGILMGKSAPKHLKTAGQLYTEQNKLMRKVNPLAILREEKKNKLYDDVLIKKRETKMITQKNIGF